MKVFTFVKRSQAMTGIYQVIAPDEQEARHLLRADGHLSAANSRMFELETQFTLDDLDDDNDKQGIPFTMEIENEGYDG